MRTNLSDPTGTLTHRKPTQKGTPMTALDIAPTTQPLVVRELKAQHRASVAEALTSAHSENTERSYTTGWNAWEKFCSTHGYQTLPASPEAFAAWLISLRDEHKAPSTIDLYRSAVLDRHRIAGHASVLEAEGVRRTVRSIHRSTRGHEKVQARALSLNELMRLVGGCDLDTYQGLRDRAWWLLATATGLRYSDSAVLTRARVRFIQGKGAVITVPWSKTDQEGVGVELPVPSLRPEHAGLDAVKAVKELLDVLPEGDDQPLFPGLYKGGMRWREGVVSNKGLNLSIVALAEKVGVSTENLTTHSARATFATNAYKAGISEHAISMAGRWSSLTVQRGYRRVTDAERFTVIASDWTQRLMSQA